MKVRHVLPLDNIWRNSHVFTPPYLKPISVELPVNSNTIEVTYNDTRLVDTLIERVLIIAPTFVS